MPNKISLSATGAFWLSSAVIVMILPFPWIGAILLSVAAHELSHLLVLRWFGIPVHVLRLTGRGIYMETAPLLPMQQIICSLAGPLGGLSLMLCYRWLPKTAFCALVQSCFHLLPVYPLDGGSALYGWTRYMGFPNGPRICAAAEILVLLVAAALGIVFAFYEGWWLPLTVSLIFVFRLVQEKYLAKNRGKGYNIATN